MKALTADQKQLLIEIMLQRRNKIESDLAKLRSEREDICRWLTENDSEA